MSDSKIGPKYVVWASEPYDVEEGGLTGWRIVADSDDVTAAFLEYYAARQSYHRVEIHQRIELKVVLSE